MKSESKTLLKDVNKMIVAYTILHLRVQVCQAKAKPSVTGDKTL